MGLLFARNHGILPKIAKLHTDVLQPYVPARLLRSSNAALLKPLKYNLKTHGLRSFSVAAPQLWNCLPIDKRLCDSFSVFKSKLKTYLFRLSY